MQLEYVVANLKRNGYDAYLVEKKDEVLPLISQLVPQGAKVGAGGSHTLEQCGVIEFLRSGSFTFYDRFKPDITAEQREELFALEKGADYYFSGTNAITLDGDLYNVDGRSNRVSAIAHGPKNVIIVVGSNKIVANLDEAVLRVKTVAAPKNCVRLNSNTFCALHGKCASLLINSKNMTDGCKSPGRICCNYLVSGKQRIVDRIKVILVNESLGF